MALTRRTDGTGTVNQVFAAWWNDYMDLVTGVMTDQPTTLNYRPGGSTSTPVLALKGNGNAPLLQGYNSDNTTVNFKVDSAGTVQSGGLTLPKMRSFGGATAGKAIWVMTGSTDPTSANGLSEGDLVFKY